MMTSVATGQRINTHIITPELQTQENIWARAAQKGDQAAFMHIVESYQRPVYNMCYRMLGEANEAEDAAQETFLRVYTKINGYDPKCKFSSWILSIAAHYCIDRLRRRRYQIVSWDDLQTDQWLSATEPEPEQVALSHESCDALHQMLDALPPDYRAATILRYWQEMSYEEIAETLNTTVSTIKSRLFRARKMMVVEVEKRNISRKN